MILLLRHAEICATIPRPIIALASLDTGFDAIRALQRRSDAGQW